MPSAFLGYKADVTSSCGPGIHVDIAFFQPHLPPPCAFLQMTIWDTHHWYVGIIPEAEAIATLGSEELRRLAEERSASHE